jgi:hypothetical protein
MDVCDVLGSLLDRPVSCTVGARVAITFDEPGMVGVYVDDNLTMVALVLLDVPLAAASGAALGLLPQRVVEASLVSNALTDAVAENVGEVLNVITQILSAPEGPHLRLHRVYRPDELLPSDIAGVASRLGRRVDLELSVAGYGNGQLSIVYD